MRAFLALAIASGSDVRVLSTETFAETVAGSAYTFVEFYAPWCGHCKKLEPVWEELATKLLPDGVPVAKVDAIAEEKLASKHGVQSFPTLRLFRGDPAVSVLYNGPRTADKMAEWARRWTTAELLERADPSNPPATGLVAAGADDNARRLAEAAAFMLNPRQPQSEFAVAASEDVGAFGVDGPSLILFRDFPYEESRVVFPVDPDSTFEEFWGWLGAARVPALIPARKDTESFFLSDIQPGHGLLMYLGDDDDVIKELHQYAVEAKSSASPENLKFIHVSGDDFGESVAKMVGCTKKDFPELLVWEFGESEDQDLVFRYSQQSVQVPLGKTAASALATGWAAKKLAAVPDPVLVVTTATFESAVFRKDADVLVEFYAPWCGHCKKLAPVYKELARHYAEDPAIVIAKLDATKHRHKSAEVKSYPTLKLYRAGSEEPVDAVFKANRDLKSLIEFIEGNRTSAVEAAADLDSAPDPSDGGASAASEAVWIFDDPAHPKLRGSELSDEMVRSAGKHTLVQVDSQGILVTQGTAGRKTFAVRRFGSSALARAYLGLGRAEL